ncbi:pH-response regulator protein palA/rim20, partial [Spiromyces aspiralis]
NAAGVFEHLREKCIGECRSTLTADLSSCHLTCLESIALALAQECAWKSAVIKGFKDGTVARLAMQVVVLYDNALEAAQNPDAPSVVSRYWGNYISIKKLYFEAEARNRKAIEALSNSQHGQEVAQLQLARDAINEAYQIIEEDKTRAMRKLNPMLVNEIKSFRNTILETTQRAVSDNDIIYLDAVPPPSSLPPIMPAKMTRPSLPEIIASPENFSGESDLGSPLFKALLPFVVHEAASVYEDRKEQLVVRDIIASLDELTAQSENILSSLNLPYALEAVEKPIGVPPSLLSASDQIRSEGGLNALRRLVITIKRHRSSATEILKKSQEALDAELAEDNELRQTHSDSDFVRSRTPSSELTVGLRTQLQHYSAILAKAKESDNSMEGMLETWGGYIGILSLPRDELEQKIPSTTGSSIDDPHHALVIERLHGFLDEVKEMTRQRRANIKELRQFAASDDIGPALNTEMARLSAASSTPIMKFELYHFEDLFNSRLEEYRKWSQYVEDEREAQKELLDCIQEANQAFISARKNHPQLEARESMLANLELAARHFNMLSSNLHEGIKFYDDLKVQLDKLNNSCLDFALARQMDITEMTGGNDDHDRGNGGYRQYTDTTSTASPNPTTWDPSMPLQYISRPRKN